MKLTGIEKRWVNAIGSAFAPEGKDTPTLLSPRPGEVDYAEVMIHANRSAGPKVRYGVRVAVALLALAPVWHQRRLASIESLSPTDRTELFKQLSDHPVQLIRELSLLMKVQASFALLGNERMRARSSYDKDRDLGTPIQIRLPNKKRQLEVAS